MTSLVTLSTGERIAPSFRYLPFGRLLCSGVACRTGIMHTQAVNLGGLPDMDPRLPVELLHPDSMGGQPFADQFTGLPITLGHPEERVTPETAKAVTVGVCLLGRPLGDGVATDMVLYDREAVVSVVSGQTEQLSVGYETDFVALGAARLGIENPELNHLALVKDGVCGARCGIERPEESPEDMIRSYLDLVYT